jgi:hypothetical protein
LGNFLFVDSGYGLKRRWGNNIDWFRIVVIYYALERKIGVFWGKYQYGRANG